MKYFITLIILFSGYANLSAQTFSFYRTSPEMIYTNDTFGVISFAKIMNMSGSNNPIRLIRVSVNYPVGWESCFCDIVQCHPTGTDTAVANYPPGLSDIAIMLYSHSIPGTGYITVRAEKVSNPNENYTVVFGGTYSPIGIRPISTVAEEFELSQNYPNPFNPSTKITFSIPHKSYVSLKVYDVLGRELRVLVNETLTQGEYEVDFNAGGFASGIYYYRLNADEHVSVRKMIVLK